MRVFLFLSLIFSACDYTPPPKPKPDLVKLQVVYDSCLKTYPEFCCLKLKYNYLEQPELGISYHMDVTRCDSRIITTVTNESSPIATGLKVGAGIAVGHAVVKRLFK